MKKVEAMKVESGLGKSVWVEAGTNIFDPVIRWGQGGAAISLGV
jgi:hypothetical protein